MFTSLWIENFRCYRSLRLDNLARFNVVVGDNASGKTSFLEAIYLLISEGPSAALRLRQWRGLAAKVDGSNPEFESLWSDLFSDFITSLTIKVGAADVMGDETELQITLGDPELVGAVDGDEHEFANAPVVSFRRRAPNQPENTVRMRLAEGLRGGMFLRTHPGAMLSPGNTRSSATILPWFSDISRQNRKTDLLELVTEDFPFVRDLSIESFQGRIGLFAQVDHAGQKLPVELVSAGFTQYLTLLLAILSHPGGLLLVDEIEGELYHRLLPLLWRRVVALSQRHDVQLFASTHSIECLDAVLPEVERQPDEFVLLRAQRRGGASTVKRFAGNSFEAALEQRVEVR